ncbi:hypothetical protein JRO89_XS09G0202000 [Xanthoceras sorbifolium]|uniref:Uncharacterized protein n=1 Tax=Xanthoceras sorbifolium TaxID=99658 RepID=A0ABQ8HMA1_9ROSI|nr:hypothetical protein JRO89_XS09G0202000 [Xanthoceras sorbifolium]
MHALELGSCKLVSPEILSGLRKLSLNHIYADDNVIESVVAHCPWLNILRLDSCFGFNSLENLVEVKIKMASDASKLVYSGKLISFSLDVVNLSESQLEFFHPNNDIKYYAELLPKFLQCSKVVQLKSPIGGK